MNLKALIRKAKAADQDPIGKGTKSTDLARSIEIEECLAGELSTLPWKAVPASCRISGPPTVFLCDEWLPSNLEAMLLDILRHHHDNFVQLRGKRTARFGGDPGPPFVPETLPPWLTELCNGVAVAWQSVGSFNEAFIPNHVLINHYKAGEGIMPHTDGPAYTPIAAILSVGSATVFDFWRDHAHSRGDSPATLSLLVKPRSLLIFTDDAYSSHLHGITDRSIDELDGLANWDCNADATSDWSLRQLNGSCLLREERFSLTIRHVPLCTGE